MRYIGGHIPNETHEKIKAIAKREDRPVVWVLNKFIENGVENDGDLLDSLEFINSLNLRKEFLAFKKQKQFEADLLRRLG